MSALQKLLRLFCLLKVTVVMCIKVGQLDTQILIMSLY